MDKKSDWVAEAIRDHEFGQLDLADIEPDSMNLATAVGLDASGNAWLSVTLVHMIGDHTPEGLRINTERRRYSQQWSTGGSYLDLKEIDESIGRID